MAEEQKTEDQPAISPPVDVQAEPKTEHRPGGGSHIERFRDWYAQHKKWTIPASVLLVILLLAAIPFTRYNLAGLVLKRDFTVRVLDSTSNTPVSGADVSLGQLSAQTDSAGTATLHHVKVGHHKVVLSKKYYQDRTIGTLTPIFSQKSTPSFQLIATGRQVKITVTNLISKKPIANAGIKAAGITARTDKDGTAVIVLPAGAAEQKASLSADGFNGADVTIKISNDKIQDNSFSLAPSGKVYFLSKLSGKIDVVKTNLDGSGRQTVLGGTGKEDDNNTVLLASRDWKYLALLSRRAGGTNPSLYLIDTSNDTSSIIDEGNASFGLVGWLNDDFVYTVDRNDLQLWQTNRQAIKSFNAPAKKLTTLDQTTAIGSSGYDYVTQLIGAVYAFNSQVFYVKNWTSGLDTTGSLDNQQATLNSVKPDGSAKKAIRSFPGAAGTHPSDLTLDSIAESPTEIELRFYDGTKDNFYEYANGQVKASATLNNDNFYGDSYPTYLQSPSGSNTFWSEARDGKNTLFIGDQNGENGKQIATLSDYQTYGWYTDNYLLVSKNASELYVMSQDGKQPAVKISDYHKPARTFNGYGGGYGGL